MTHLVTKVDLAQTTQTSIVEEELRQSLADRLESLASELRTVSGNHAQAGPTGTTMIALARKVYAARREIDKVFGMIGFSVSPAWDIMLDLYVAESQDKQISVTSACIGAACPPTTGLRWLQALEDRQLISRTQDLDDKRRAVVSLTKSGKAKVAEALSFHL